jgi:hypothetical protein
VRVWGLGFVRAADRGEEGVRVPGGRSSPAKRSAAASAVAQAVGADRGGESAGSRRLESGREKMRRTGGY